MRSDCQQRPNKILTTVKLCGTTSVCSPISEHDWRYTMFLVNQPRARFASATLSPAAASLAALSRVPQTPHDEPIPFLTLHTDAPAVHQRPSAPIRRRSALTQQQRDLVLKRSIHLNESDRCFIKQILSDGRTCRDVASTVSVVLATLPPSTTPDRAAAPRLTTSQFRAATRALQRRFLRLASRLLSPECAYLLSPHQRLCPTRLRICRLHFVQGRSLRQISHSLALPIHIVRRICEHLSAQAAQFDVDSSRVSRS